MNANKLQLKALEEVTLHGEDLPGFMNEWDRVIMYFGGKLPDFVWMEELFRTQLEKSHKFRIQLEMYYTETMFANPPQPYSHRTDQ